MMSLPQVCIRRPVLATMMNVALVLFGIISLINLPVRELPNIDPPIVNVTTIYPGADASVMETEVTERLEESINSVEGVRSLTSESREQVSSITVEFDLARDIETAAQDVRDRVARVRGQLPDDIEEPIIAKQEADANPVIWISLFSDRYSTLELTGFAEDIMLDPLRTVKGVSSVFIGGEKRYATRLRLDPDRMAALSVTVLDVRQALRTQNVELPSGRIENFDREMTIQTRGDLKEIEDFNRLVIRAENGSLVRLSDIGHAEVGVEDERSLARYNSKPSVGLGVVKQSTANTIEVAKAVKTQLEQLKLRLPEDVEVALPYDEAVYVEKSIDEVWVTLGIAFVLVVLTIFIFLRNLRSTVVPALSIPVSILATFMILSLMGYTVNTLTMLALVLAIGVVVDDSIVVLENIYRHIEDGMPPMDAAKKGMSEITFAIIATTIALAAVFLPLAFQTTVTGRLFVEFAIALCGSVVISSFVALTLTPMIAARILKPIAEVEHGRLFQFFERGFQRTERAYRRQLERALAHPWRIVTIGLLSLVAAAFFYTRLDKEFLPEENKGRLLCIAIAPEGATADYTDRMVKKIENIVREVPEVGGYFSITAPSFGGPGKGNQAFLFIRIADDAKRSVQDIVGGPNGLGARFFKEVEGAFAIPIIPKAVSRGFGQPFQLVIQGQDLLDLNRYASEVADQLRATGYLANVRSSFELNKPELRVIVDRDRAATLGISIESLSQTLQLIFGGQKISQTTRGGKEYQVLAQLERMERLTPADLDRLFLRNDRGELIQISGVVRLEAGGGPNAITHYNRYRSATIEATPTGVPLGTAVDRVEAMLQGNEPPGFRHTWSGETRDFKEAGGGFLLVVVLALVVVYMVLASQFESLLHPLTVMLTIPLAAVGAFGALWILSGVNQLGTGLHGWAHYAPDPPAAARWLSAAIPRIPAMGINLFSQVGLVLLIGLVTKNSILLVDFANQQVAKGKDARTAMLEAGSLRLRPILMTSFSTILGILPLAIGFGAGAESRRPMGVAALGGLITSTVLTLFLIPVVYVFFSRLSTRLSRKKSAKTVLSVLLMVGLFGATSRAQTAAIEGGGVETPPQISEGVVYDLEHCLQAALSCNFDIQKGRERIRRESGASVVVRAPTIPSVAVVGGFTQMDPDYLQAFGGFKPNDQSWMTKIELTQLLYSGGGVRAAIRQQDLQEEAAVIAFQSTVGDVLLDVKKRYYAVILAREQVVVNQKYVDLLQEELQSAQFRFSAGSVSSFDVLRAEVALANAQTPLIRARYDSRLALQELSRVIGRTSIAEEGAAPAFDVHGDLRFEPLGVDLKEAQETALSNRPELKRLDRLFGAAGQALKAAAAGNRPNVNVYGNYGVQNDRDSDDLADEVHGWEVGLRVSWPLFDGLMTRGRIAEARAELSLRELDRQQRRQEIIVEVQRAHAALVESTDLVHATHKVVEQAGESVRQARARLDTGAATQLDVLYTQVALTMARSNEVQALHDFNVAVSQIRWAMGVSVTVTDLNPNRKPLL